MAPVIAALAKTQGVTSRVCVTGQHRSMLQNILETFAVEPDVDLAVMQPNQSLTDVCTRVMVGLDRLLVEQPPNCVLVQGDTITSTAAALTAFYRRIPVGHIEAGLRTGDLFSPWPEEANRRLTAVIADRHYAPTERARTALLREGVPADSIRLTGNTGIDALVTMRDIVTKGGSVRDAIESRYAWIDRSARTILVTGHRRESFGTGFLRICDAIAAIADRSDVQIIYPVHLNPNVRGPVFERLADHPRIKLIEPLDYADFVYLMTRADVILTDSGGIQEEAPMLRKPVLVMRDTSERSEAIDAGVARLVGTDPREIVASVDRLLDDAAAYAAMASGASPFGDGHASARIVEDLIERFGLRTKQSQRHPRLPEFLAAERLEPADQPVA